MFAWRKSERRQAEVTPVSSEYPSNSTRPFLVSSFVRTRPKPTVAQMMRLYRVLRSEFKATLRSAGAKDPFNARVFSDLCVIAKAAADAIVLRTER